MRRRVGRQGCSGTGEIQSAVGALMSVGTESGEQCEVIAAFMARYLIRVAPSHLMKNKMAWYLIQVALTHLMKMATSVCISTTNTKRAQNLQEQLPSAIEFAIPPEWDLLLEMTDKNKVDFCFV